jgi:hypothetical protein
VHTEFAKLLRQQGIGPGSYDKRYEQYACGLVFLPPAMRIANNP